MNTTLPKGLRVGGSHATDIIKPPKEKAVGPAFAYRLSMRRMSIAEFRETRGSGTLRKNAAIGMNTVSHAPQNPVRQEAK